MLSTHNMGGVSIQPDELRAMQVDDYILHARDKEIREGSCGEDPAATRS